MKTLLRWFLSKDVRNIINMRRHVWKLVQHQRDLLSGEALAALTTAINDSRKAVAAGAGAPELKTQMENLEAAANKWLKPYPNAAWRENVEVFLVAIALAIGIRTFFIQPFKIPTGSMQPTLYGVESENLKEHPELQIPSGIDRVRQWFAGRSYVRIVAKTDGAVEEISTPVRFFNYNIYQTLRVGGQTYSLWFPPDYGEQTLESRAGISIGQEFKTGEDIVKMLVIAGDYLFVDRVSYNFRRPARGDIVVFETRGINGLRQDQFYIKRLVGLRGERLRIGNDRHLVINDERLDARTPHFEFVYSFNKTNAPRSSHFSGHLNELTAQSWGLLGMSVPLFRSDKDEVTVHPHGYFVMGDNTCSSLDSRYWGSVPEQNVIGKSCFVFWPISERFGMGYR
jgi:signal peptidase I